MIFIHLDNRKNKVDRTELILVAPFGYHAKVMDILTNADPTIRVGPAYSTKLNCINSKSIAGPGAGPALYPSRADRSRLPNQLLISTRCAPLRHRHPASKFAAAAPIRRRRPDPPPPPRSAAAVPIQLCCSRCLDQLPLPESASRADRISKIELSKVYESAPPAPATGS